MTARTVDHRRLKNTICARSACVFALLFASNSFAQMTFATRGAQNSGSCGVPGAGPSVTHNLNSLSGTSGDDVSLSDPGPPAASDAVSHLEAHPSPNSLVLSNSGHSHRSGGGVSSIADARDNWEFTVATTSCFTLAVSLDVSSNAPPSLLGSFNFGNLGGAITLSDGTHPTTLTQSMTSTGHFEMTWTGTLSPGRYFASLGGRSDQNNTAPYSGTYANSLSLTLGTQPLVSSPISTTVCPSGLAAFSVTPGGTGPFTYQWQIETASNVWQTLGNDPAPLPCGGVAFASPSNSPTTNIGVRRCPGPFRVRVVVTSTCGGVTSNPATLTICVADTDDGSGSGACDGGVTIDDLLYYLNLFEQGAATADVDDGSGTGTLDGGVTIDDLLYYLVRFESGC